MGNLDRTLSKPGLGVLLVTLGACLDSVDGLTGGPLDGERDGDGVGGSRTYPEEDGSAGVDTFADVSALPDARAAENDGGHSDASGETFTDDADATPTCAERADGADCGLCPNRQCGPDPATGRTCGTCTAAGETCNANGLCGAWCPLGLVKCTDDNQGIRACHSDPRAVSGEGAYGPPVPCTAGATCSHGECIRTHCVQGEVLFVAESSAAMATSGAWTWLVASLAKEATLHEERSLLGLRQFPNDTGCEAGLDTAIALGNADAIRNALTTPAAPLSSPIAAALGNLAPKFGSAGDAKAVILLTAGYESCATTQDAASLAAETLWRSGIRVYVVGLTAAANRTFLDSIALAGGTTASRLATDESTLEAALEAIFSDLGACSCSRDRKLCLNDTFYTCNADGVWNAPEPCQTTLSFFPPPASNVFAGIAWPSLGVRAIDSAGDPTPAQISLSLVSGGGVLLGTTTRTTVQGVATFDDLRTTVAGKCDLQATVVGNSQATAAAKMQVVGATQLAVGAGHTCAILDQGGVKCWGRNESGQLGLGNTDQRGDGAGEMGENLPPVNLGTGRTALAVATGGAHTCAILDNHLVKCWGHNGKGQLGIGDTHHRGDNPDEMGDALPTVPLGTNRTALSLAAGGEHTCAILDDHTIKCWGSNWAGQLGVDDTDNRGDSTGEMGDGLLAVHLGIGRTALFAATGGDHTCAILDDHAVKCWGANSYGQLGLGDSVNRGDIPSGLPGGSWPAVSLGTGRTALALAAGGRHTCALLDNYSVKCWGANYFGELGLGDAIPRGDSANEMNNNLLAVELGTGRSAVVVGAGDEHTCALLDNHSVKCWGSNFAGELGVGDTSSRGTSPLQMGDSLPSAAVGNTCNPVGIAVGGMNTCVRCDSAVKCWGSNTYGQIGVGNTSNYGHAPGNVGDNLPFVAAGP